MAIKLDKELLDSLGLGSLDSAESTLLLKHMYEKMEEQVGLRLAKLMTDTQMDEFEVYIDSNDEQGAFEWLAENFPDYKDVVQEEFENLKEEVRSLAPQILETVDEPFE